MEIVVIMTEHYEGQIEPIEYIAATFNDDEYRGFLKGNVIKYISRAGKKGDAIEDFLKAKKYLEWLIEDAAEDASDIPNRAQEIADRQAEWLRSRDRMGWT